MVSVGSVQFQIAPCSSLHFSISTGPFQCSRCSLQGFLSVELVPSEAVPFVYLTSVCPFLQCVISTLTQVGGGGLMFRFASSVMRGEGGALLSPSTLLRLPAALYGVCPVLRVVPVFGYSTKVWTRLHLHFVPSPARAAQAARSLIGTLSLGVPRPLPSVAPASASICASRVHAPCI